MVNDEVHGESYKFDKHGEISVYKNYNNGVEQGEYYEFYDGILRAHGYMRNGVQHGECRSWDSDGDFYEWDIFADGTSLTDYPRNLRDKVIEDKDKFYLKLRYDIKFLDEGVLKSHNAKRKYPYPLEHI